MPNSKTSLSFHYGNDFPADRPAVIADNAIASALLDRPLHHSITINMNGESFRLKGKKKTGVIAPNANKEAA